MNSKPQIDALFHLLEEEDQSIYFAVADKLLSFGNAIIPELKTRLCKSNNEVYSQKLENILNVFEYRDIKNSLKEWNKSETSDLLLAAIQIAKFEFRDIRDEVILKEIEQMKICTDKSLSRRMKPIDQIKAINKILYQDFRLIGNEVVHTQIDHFLINRVLLNKRGNALTLGIIYLSLCRRLDLPIFAINIPKQFILAYFDNQDSDKEDFEKILHFIDPINGMLFSLPDIERYLSRMKVRRLNNIFHKQSNKQIIGLLLNEIISCYTDSEQGKESKASLKGLLNLFQ